MIETWQQALRERLILNCVAGALFFSLLFLQSDFHGIYGKGEINFGGGGFGFLEIAIIHFMSQLLFNLLFTCRLKDL